MLLFDHLLQEEQRAYNNREQCRDQFYAIIREAASAYSAFGWVSSGSEGEGFLKMKDAVHQFLHVLLVENYPWFAGEILSSHYLASHNHVFLSVAFSTRCVSATKSFLLSSHYFQCCSSGAFAK